jgi:hypothetical protein
VHETVRTFAPDRKRNEERVMRPQTYLGVLLVAAGLALTASPARTADIAKPAGNAAQAAAAAAKAEPKLEAKAIDLLKAMSARLAAARTMSFQAVSRYESPSRFGPPLLYATVSEVTLQRPDKLRVVSPGDGPASEFYYDGKQMMAYAPAEDLVAVADAPPTIDGALKAAYDTADIYFPFTDVIVADPYQAIAQGLKVAFYIGQSQAVGGVTTDMLALANDRIFAQVWIGADDKLPRMSRAVYLEDPARLRQQVELSDWKIDGAVPADAFAATPAKNAKRIPFARPDPKVPAELQAAAKAAKAGTK